MEPVDRIARLRAALATVEHPRLRLAILFGSTARGTNRPDSDMDVAVLPFDLAITLDEELGLEALLERATGCHVELVRIDQITPLLAWRVARDGIVLLSDPPSFATRFRARAAIAHGDDAFLRDDATRRFRAALMNRRPATT